MKAVELQGLTRRFKDKLAVDHLNLSLEEGELFALLGVNGAGKTTTIRMLCGLLPPDEGDALLMGHSIVHEPELAKAQLNVSPQETAVAPNLTVRENLCFIAQLYGSDSRSAREKAAQMIADTWRTRPTSGLRRSLAVSSAAYPSPWRSSASRSCSFWTSRRWGWTCWSGGSSGSRFAPCTAR